ncbi:hypothetical protein BKA63DRAFT_288712 [Paraphoma chrysanthemicola]|nr:hypothetical protein BKA63DRAFT_288712 [Paraphoma chrysanthemicola]
MSLEIESRFVKRGLWTNIEHGSVMGKTITTDTRTGNLVVAVLAVVSTLGTAHLWHLLSFAYHQARANGKPSDGLFRQQQALLRTLPPPSSVVADALKLWWAWRKKADRSLLRSIVLILLALLFTVATVAASIFTSFVADVGEIEVLVDSPFCGRVNTNPDLGQPFSMTEIDLLSPQYTHSCYRNGSLPSDCHVFVQPNIPLQTSDGACPFKNKTFCATEAALVVDSGLIDVGKYFGLNFAAKDRVQYRKRSTCTVLPTDYYAIYDVKNKTLLQLLGSNLKQDQLAISDWGSTFDKVLPWASFVLSMTMAETNGYPEVRQGETYYSKSEAPIPQAWLPREDMGVDNEIGDWIIKPVVPNGISYRNPVNDPLYSAHQKMEISGRNKTYIRYKPDHPLNGVVCLQQRQFCYARKGKEDFCTPLQPQPWVLAGDSFFEASSIQNAVLTLVIQAGWLTSTSNVGISLARRRMITNQPYIDSLPDDFWKDEILSWEKESWSRMQIAMSRFAPGADGSDQPGQQEDNWWFKPVSEGEKALCSSQKMKKSGEFVNINFFGLVFILSFSLTVMVVDITILKFLIYMSRFRRQLGPRIERWIQDGVWQLQRRAYEGEGQRDWVDLESEIPLTDKGRLMKDLPILWVPGKSPMTIQTNTFESSGSQETLRSHDSRVEGLGGAVEDQTPQQESTRWYKFGRR